MERIFGFLMRRDCINIFNFPSAWKGKKCHIVFDGSMTDTEVKINGKSAGAIHQGAFYRFKYDITDLLYFDKPNNLK